MLCDIPGEPLHHLNWFQVHLQLTWEKKRCKKWGIAFLHIKNNEVEKILWELSFVTTFLADAASTVPSTLVFFLGPSSRSIVDVLAFELKLESEQSDAEDKE